MNILNKITIKTLKMNKRRTIATIVGIVLSTMLLTLISILVSVAINKVIEDSAKIYGDYHISIKIDKDKLNTIKSFKEIDKYYLKSEVAQINIPYTDSCIKEYDDETEDLEKHSLYAVDENYLEFIEIVKGRLPKENEIILNDFYFNNECYDYKLGDFIEIDDKSYKIVGIYNNYIDVDAGTMITLGNSYENITAFIKFNNPKKTENLAKKLNDKLGYTYIDRDYSLLKNDYMEYNLSLLSFYGIETPYSYLAFIAAILSIFLAIISIACFFVIYNSFAISVNERKKQFGILSSIGASKKDLYKGFLFEAIIVGIIGIIIGILASILLGNILLLLFNIVFDTDVSFKIDLLFIFLPIIFVFVIILLSANTPATIASKASPIESIRELSSIKIKNKKLKRSKLIIKMFGVEGDIARKNIKRNKEKYRITIISLVISIMLFLGASTFGEYLLKALKNSRNYLPEYDIYLNVKGEGAREFINTIVNNDSIKESTVVIGAYIVEIEELNKEFFTNKFTNYLWIENDFATKSSLNINVLDNNTYRKYKEQLNLKENVPIIYNHLEFDLEIEGMLKYMTITPYRGDVKSFRGIEIKYDNDYNKIYGNEIKIENVYYTEKKLLGYQTNSIFRYYISIFISEDMIASYNFKNEFIFNNTEIFIKCNDYDKAIELINKIKMVSDIDLNYEDYYEVNRSNNRYMVTLLTIIYGFVGLLTLIGVTSVFNTISTSINLRRKEFAMLRSIGLSERGFNKILYLESVFLGIKTLLYGMPLGIIISIAFSYAIGFVGEKSLIVPYTGIIISIIAIFIIILGIMIYSSSRLKKENILEALREDNI